MSTASVRPYFALNLSNRFLNPGCCPQTETADNGHGESRISIARLTIGPKVSFVISSYFKEI